jgi:hypothetical protein
MAARADQPGKRLRTQLRARPRPSLTGDRVTNPIGSAPTWRAPHRRRPSEVENAGFAS